MAEFSSLDRDLPRKVVTQGLEIFFKYTGQPITCYTDRQNMSLKTARSNCTATEMIPITEMIPAVNTEMIPGTPGMELRGLQKLDNNLVRAFYLFILHLFYGV